MGIVAATGLGLLIGIMRLSVNWLIRNLALVYIEFVRNTPLLVQIIFWYFAVLQTLPPPRQSIAISGGLLLNIRGLYVPSAVMADRASTLSLLSAAALVLTPLVWRLPLKGGRLGARALLLPLAAVGLFAAGIEHIEFEQMRPFGGGQAGQPAPTGDQRDARGRAGQ